MLSSTQRLIQVDKALYLLKTVSGLIDKALYLLETVSGLRELGI